jgi:hypothetical protein
MPPVDPVLPSTVTECLRIAHALTRGPAIRPGAVYLVMSRIAPLHRIYGVALDLASGRRLYEAAMDATPAWSADDAAQRALFGPIEVAPRTGPDTTSPGAGGTGAGGTGTGGKGGGTSDSGQQLMSTPIGHTCLTDPYSLESMSVSMISSYDCDEIMGGVLELDVRYRDGREARPRYRVHRGTDALFLTQHAFAEFLLRAYREFYGGGYTSRLRPPRA